MNELQQFIATIWIKRKPHKWSQLGERHVTAEGHKEALQKLKLENKLDRYIDWRIEHLREAGEYRPKIRGWR